MTILYYLFLNKIRENIRIIKKMKFSALGVSIVFAIIIAQFVNNVWPVIVGMGYNDTVCKAILACIVLLSLTKYIIKKPNIIIKPITLHLLNNNSYYNAYYGFKIACLLFKSAIISVALSVIIFGGVFDIDILIMILAMLGSKDIITWIIYNEKNKSLLITACLATVILGSSFYYDKRITLIGFVLIFLISFIYSMRFMNINSSYYKEMIHTHEIHLAQISGDTKALSKYAEEKNNSLLESQKKQIRFPIAWKSIVSILRLDINFILFGLGFFLVAYIVKITPIADSIPLLEEDIVQQMFLVLAIFFFLQLIIQVFRNEFEKLINNHKDGLFLPYDNSELIKSYSIIPLALLTIITIFIAVLVGSRFIVLPIVLFIIYFIFLVQVWLLTRSKKTLMRLSSVINMILLASCYLLFV